MNGIFQQMSHSMFSFMILRVSLFVRFKIILIACVRSNIDICKVFYQSCRALLLLSYGFYLFSRRRDTYYAAAMALFNHCAYGCVEMSYQRPGIEVIPCLIADFLNRPKLYNIRKTAGLPQIQEFRTFKIMYIERINCIIHA